MYPTLPHDTVYPTPPRDTLYPTLPRDTVYPTLPRDTLYPTLPRDTLYPTLPRDTMYPTLPRDTMYCPVQMAVLANLSRVHAGGLQSFETSVRRALKSASYCLSSSLDSAYGQEIHKVVEVYTLSLIHI